MKENPEKFIASEEESDEELAKKKKAAANAVAHASEIEDVTSLGNKTEVQLAEAHKESEDPVRDHLKRHLPKKKLEETIPKKKDRPEDHPEFV